MSHDQNYPSKLRTEYPRISPNFQNCVHCEKDLKDNNHTSLYLVWKCAIHCHRRYLFLEAVHNVLWAMLLENCSFSEQIMSADKYPSIFSHQRETIVIYFHYMRILQKETPPVKFIGTLSETSVMFPNQVLVSIAWISPCSTTCLCLLFW